MENIMKNLTKLIIAGVVAIFLLILLLASTTIIPAGHTGVLVRMGAVQDGVLQEGLHIKTPFVTSVKKVDNRVIRVDVEGSSSSNDLQTVNATVSVNYRVNPLQSANLYKNVGKDYEATIVRPAIQESLKAVTALYSAEELITKRQEIGSQMRDNLNEKISDYGLTVEQFNIINFSFSEEFDRAIEAKQTAQQEALKAEQDLLRIKVEAEQTITKAEAEAEANRLISQSITPELIQMKEAEARLQHGWVTVQGANNVVTNP